MKKNNIYFKPLREEDLSMLCEWLNRPHLQQWWREEEISLAGVREKYLPRISGVGAAIPFLAYKDQMPAGYIQYYHANAGNNDWWPDKPGPDVVGIDLFIADETILNRGIGTAIVKEFIQGLVEKIHPVEIRIDPNPGNIAAIKCYQKAGFIKKKLINTPDGPAMMMVYKVT
jgi:aminoglycoside 6'-N-acetyltransferase-1b/aminoglycoside 6'-N-acetyltransferase-2